MHVLGAYKPTPHYHHQPTMPYNPDVRSHPIGVFDSGIGGLSVLRALRHTLPQEHFVYYADTAHAPYGGHNKAFIQQRCEHIVQTLIRCHRIKALVIACNTATAAAADQLRQMHPQLPVIGVEPGLKPAALASRTGHVGVLATRSTLASKRFRQLLHNLATSTRVRFHLTAGVGLVRAIEACGNAPSAATEQRLAVLCRQHIASLPPFGKHAGQLDQLVLGCTHYIWAQQELRSAIQEQMQTQHHSHIQLAESINIVHTAQPVARQTAKILSDNKLLNQQPMTGNLELTGSGERVALHRSAMHWL